MQNPKDKNKAKSEDALRAFARKTQKQVAGAELFISLVSEKYAEEPECVIQLGLAILMDKPLYLLVEKGVPVSGALRRAAKQIEEWNRDDPASIERGTKKMLDNFAADLNMPRI